MHWTHPAAGGATVVATSDELARWAAAISEAAVCGIDCEWPPEHTARRPSAALVQLALWSPRRGLAVLLLDVASLPLGSARGVLQALLRSATTLKVGYGLPGDLRAIGAALGQDGANAVYVVTPALDLGTLHAFLLQGGAPGVAAPRGRGLSGIVEAQVGSALDKGQQCSAWGQRPLTQEQRAYAANDACCLLALLDDLMQRVGGRPGKWALGGAEEVDERLAPANDGGGPDAGGNAAVEIAQEHRTSGETGSQPATQAFAWTCGQLQEASAAWGQRLEMVGETARWRDRSGRLRARPWTPPAAARSAAKESNGSPELPAHVPWMDAQRRLTSPPRFLADVMAQGLARQLRLWGVDAEAVEAAGKSQRHQVHRQLVEQAERESRVILTRDQTFVRRRLTDSAYLVRADTKGEQLLEVVAVFGLPVGGAALLSRCARCNGEFGPAAVPAAALPEGHGVPAGVAERIEAFWVCLRCEAVYWQGCMYARAMERLTCQLAAMAVAKGEAQHGGDGAGCDGDGGSCGGGGGADCTVALADAAPLQCTP